MKRNSSDFDDKNDVQRIIGRLISKLTSGEFEVESFDISRSDQQQEAKVRMKINGGPISILQPDDRGDDQDQAPSGSGKEKAMTPDEKEVQAQIASCYL